MPANNNILMLALLFYANIIVANLLNNIGIFNNYLLITIDNKRDSSNNKNKRLFTLDTITNLDNIKIIINLFRGNPSIREVFLLTYSFFNLTTYTY